MLYVMMKAAAISKFLDKEMAVSLIIRMNVLYANVSYRYNNKNARLI
jgi:hypothetical protein